jgi:hypothetical protein
MVTSEALGLTYMFRAVGELEVGWSDMVAVLRSVGGWT